VVAAEEVLHWVTAIGQPATEERCTVMLAALAKRKAFPKGTHPPVSAVWREVQRLALDLGVPTEVPLPPGVVPVTLP
jgi:hypothetical protein